MTSGTRPSGTPSRCWLSKRNSDGGRFAGRAARARATRPACRMLAVAEAMGLNADDLPFVAELIDVRPEFDAWRTASRTRAGRVRADHAGRSGNCCTALAARSTRERYADACGSREFRHTSHLESSPTWPPCRGACSSVTARSPAGSRTRSWTGSAMRASRRQLTSITRLRAHHHRANPARAARRAWRSRCAACHRFLQRRAPPRDRRADPPIDARLAGSNARRTA